MTDYDLSTSSHQAPLVRERISGPGDSIAHFPEISHMQEHFRVLCLDVKNGIISNDLVSIGTASASLVHRRDILRRAIVNNASGILVMHNHPTGEVTPSSEDLAFTTDLFRACELIGIKLVDHVIVGGPDSFYSLKGNNELTGYIRVPSDKVAEAYGVDYTPQQREQWSEWLKKVSWAESVKKKVPSPPAGLPILMLCPRCGVAMRCLSDTCIGDWYKRKDPK